MNDAVLHGVPYDYNLKDGDLVSLDLAINVDGWVADSAISFCVGTQHPDDLRLIKCTEEALAAGIEAAQPGQSSGRRLLRRRRRGTRIRLSDQS